MGDQDQEVFRDIDSIPIPTEVVLQWQTMADLLSTAFGIPVALVMRYRHPHIEVLVSSRTDGNPYTPGDREVLPDSGLYCERVIETDERLLVEDALADPDWDSNPDIELGMVSYLGYPVRYPEGEPFGTICVLDEQANDYDTTIERTMVLFRDLIESHLALLFLNHSLGDSGKSLVDYLDEMKHLSAFTPICVNCKSIRDEDGAWHRIEEVLQESEQVKLSHGVCPSCFEKLYPGQAKRARDRAEDGT